MRLLASMILFSISISSNAAPVQVASGRINEQFDGTQLVLDFNTSPSFETFWLENPPRLVLDIKNGRLTIPARQLSHLRSTDVLSIRSGIQNGTDLRIVMDLPAKIDTKTTLIENNGYHLVVDFYRPKIQKAGYIPGKNAKLPVIKPGGIRQQTIPENNSNNSEDFQFSQGRSASAPPATPKLEPLILVTAPRSLPPQTAARPVPVNNNSPQNIILASVEKPQITPEKTAPLPPKKPEVSGNPITTFIGKTVDSAIAAVTPSTSKPIPREQRGPIVVAIDPGHGGKDPGARGPGGTQEKLITMSVAKKLAVLIDSQEGMKACLTRTTDVYLHLYKRIDIARNKCQADLFVSIHADAFYEPHPEGASVFILSTKGASSSMARWLAKSENQSDTIGGKINVKDKNLKKVVLDMVQDASMVESRAMAQKVMRRLGGIGKLHSRKIEQANFAVLKSPEIPSILVETAFISNPEEEQKLRNSAYQKKLAKAILDGILDYTVERPHLNQPRSIIAAR